MAKLLEYRGYHAKVEYNPEDNLLVGNVLGISDSLNFHAENTTDLIEYFHNSVDNYLAFCAKIGKEPDKEYSGTFNIRVSPELHKKAFLRAQEEGITLNKVVENALTAYLSADALLINRFATGVEAFANSVKMLSASISLTSKSTVSDATHLEVSPAQKRQNLVAFPSNNYDIRKKIAQ